VLEALKQCVGSQQSRARRSELNRERQTIQATADRLDRLARLELAPGGTDTLAKQRHGVARKQWIEQILALA
jgi:hypothetical protein